MLIVNPNKEELSQIFSNLENYIKENFTQKWVKYVNLGSQIVRLVSYSEEYKPLLEKQLEYSLLDNSDEYDATIVLWQENDFRALAAKLSDKFDLKKNLKLRIEALQLKREIKRAKILDETYSSCNAVLFDHFDTELFEAVDVRSNTYYYALKDLQPEEFIKQGHALVKMFNKITKTDSSNLVHGAVVGVDNKGILFCARGQRGKSTLVVLSMMKGFEYVSDDYLILEKENENVYSHPIYSIITLSPKMYNELYKEMEGCQFVSNNARKDKYVFNINKFHNQFKRKYPIELCIFPEIVNQEKPSIAPCTEEEKGRAIVQLIQSTVSQMEDLSNNEVALKLFDMIKNFKFYKLNLCPDIHQNTEFLRDFVRTVKFEKEQTSFKNPVFEDITFDVANVLDSRTGVIYTMNKFATNVYENLKNGVSKKQIVEKLRSIAGMPDDINAKIDLFIEKLTVHGIILNIHEKDDASVNINEEFIKEDKYKLSMKEFKQQKTTELI